MPDFNLGRENYDWGPGRKHNHDYRFFSMKWDRCMGCNGFRPHRKDRPVPGMAPRKTTTFSGQRRTGTDS